MNDLIEKLRFLGKCDEVDLGSVPAYILYKAADEIMRLRSDRLDCQNVMDSQQAEIERLRAAIRCERETGICIAVHEPYREPCTAESCRFMDDAYQQTATREK